MAQDGSNTALGGAFIGTAGWQIPRAVADAFATEGSTLTRYAGRFPVVEINSTFYRAHRAQTFVRWAETTPPGFRFSVKLSKLITHERRLVDAAAPLDQFLAEVANLGGKLGPLLVQLPPSLAFDAEVAARFFGLLRDRHPGEVACEPRHVSWFADDADQLLAGMRVARVAADPARAPEAARPGGWTGLAYWRLHGSPRMYYSAYTPEQLDDLAVQLKAARGSAWCIFDNTTSGAAAADALALSDRSEAPGASPA